jgi:hypothetical protein
MSDDKKPDTGADKAPAAETKSNKPKAQPAIQVRAARGERFCRAGRCFGKEPETVTDYTREQLEAWEAETNLVVIKDALDEA